MLKSYSAALNQRSSPFLKLPSEIRNIIYGHALGGTTLVVSFLPSKNENNDEKPERALRVIEARRCSHGAGTLLGSALLRVSRQIHEEAWLLPYSQNTFEFNHDEVFFAWLQILHPSAKAAVSSISLGKAIRAYRTATRLYFKFHLAWFQYSSFVSLLDSPKVDQDHSIHSPYIMRGLEVIRNRLPGLKRCHLIVWARIWKQNEGLLDPSLRTSVLSVAQDETTMKVLQEWVKKLELPNVRMDVELDTIGLRLAT
jgi:hypothetical protein